MKRTLLLAALALCAVAAAVGVAEAALRYRESRAGVLGPTPLMYYRHNRLQRAFVRGMHVSDRIRINRYGFRGPDIEVRKAPGTTRIMAVGASATFDVCAERDTEAWPARLEHWLEARAPERQFEVINAGVPGYLMLDNIIRLQNELHVFGPDVIILYAGHGTISAADLARFRQPSSAGTEPSSRTPDAMPVATPWGNWLSRHSLIYNKGISRFQSLKKRSRGSGATPVDRQRWEDVLRGASDEFRRDLVSFVLVARSVGARIVVVELAHMSASPGMPLTATEELIWTSAFTAPADITLEGYRRFSAVQRAVSDSLGATFIPATTFGITGERRYCTGDPIHLNRAGAELMGRRLAESLLASGALDLSRQR